MAQTINLKKNPSDLTKFGPSIFKSINATFFSIENWKVWYRWKEENQVFHIDRSRKKSQGKKNFMGLRGVPRLFLNKWCRERKRHSLEVAWIFTPKNISRKKPKKYWGFNWVVKDLNITTSQLDWVKVIRKKSKWNTHKNFQRVPVEEARDVSMNTWVQFHKEFGVHIF